jgi:hypothetical protein
VSIRKEIGVLEDNPDGLKKNGRFESTAYRFQHFRLGYRFFDYLFSTSDRQVAADALDRLSGVHRRMGIRPLQREPVLLHGSW